MIVSQDADQYRPLALQSRFAMPHSSWYAFSVVVRQLGRVLRHSNLASPFPIPATVGAHCLARAFVPRHLRESGGG